MVHCGQAQSAMRRQRQATMRRPKKTASQGAAERRRVTAACRLAEMIREHVAGRRW